MDKTAPVATADDAVVALRLLACYASIHPHVNVSRDGSDLLLDDDEPGAWCLACTVGEMTQALGFDPPGDLASEADDWDRATPDQLARAQEAWDLVLTRRYSS